ncbi:MAG: hypothetical protein K1X28_01740 [Parachlamydiales bacterium]|nr:hypothetical protein [Parachlamydiales bacterium]
MTTWIDRRPPIDTSNYFAVLDEPEPIRYSVKQLHAIREQMRESGELQLVPEQVRKVNQEIAALLQQKAPRHKHRHWSKGQPTYHPAGKQQQKYYFPGTPGRSNAKKWR